MTIINILGGFCAVTICFMAPVACYVKTSDKPLTSFKNIISIILASLLCIVGFTAAIITIVHAISKPAL